MPIALLFLQLLISAACFGQDPIQNDHPEFLGQGKLVILRIIPGDKTAKLFIVGRKAAELDLKKEAQILSVFLNSSNSQEELRVNNRGEFYEVSGMPNRTSPYVLSVKTKVNDHIEDIKINIKTKMP